MSLTLEEILTAIEALTRKLHGESTLLDTDLTVARSATARGVSRPQAQAILYKLFREGKLVRYRVRDETSHFIYAYRLPQQTAKPTQPTRKKA